MTFSGRSSGWKSIALSGGDTTIHSPSLLDFADVGDGGSESDESDDSASASLLMRRETWFSPNPDWSSVLDSPFMLVFLILLGGSFPIAVDALLFDFGLVVMNWRPWASRTTFLDSLHTAVQTPIEKERFTRAQHTQSADNNHRVTSRGTKKTKIWNGSGSQSGLN